MEFQSLYVICMERLLCAPRHLARALLNLMIPYKIHVELFMHAGLSLSKFDDRLRLAVVELISHWPRDVLKLTDLFPGRQLNSVLHDGDQHTFLDYIMEGLLNIVTRSKLRVVDFCEASVPSVFQLPMLSMSQEERASLQVKEHIMEQCKTFSEDDDNMDSVLSWKLTDLSRREVTAHFRGHDPLEIHLEVKLNLTEWVAMVDEIVGLCTQEMSPYRFKFTKLSVDNYYTKESEQLKWFLSKIDTQDLSQVYIYGKTRSIRLLMWELHEPLAPLTNLRAFGLGATGPHMGSQIIGPDEPTDDEILPRCVHVMNSWSNLQVLQMVGLAMAGKLSVWLNALRQPLQKLSFYACKLTPEDLESLVVSHHLTELKQLGLEKNNIRGCYRTICGIIERCPQLELLNLRETSMHLHEKVGVLSSLCGNQKLHTLALYEKEDMLSTSGYEDVVGLACAVTALNNFYIFPFNYRPFEVFFRETVGEACTKIKLMNNRMDLQLYY